MEQKQIHTLIGFSAVDLGQASRLPYPPRATLRQEADSSLLINVSELSADPVMPAEGSCCAADPNHPIIRGCSGTAHLSIPSCRFSVAIRIGSLTDGSLFCDNHAVCGAATAYLINRSGEKT